MNDEDAFLRAIHAAPTDNLPKLVYADWLDERRFHDKAGYVRHTAGGQRAWQNPIETIGAAWMDLYSGGILLWDAPTMLALGRLQGMLDGLAAGNDHRADVAFHFSAALVPFDGELPTALTRLFPRGEPTAIPLDDWRTTLRGELARWIGMDQGTATRRASIQRAHQTPDGCVWTADRVLQLASEVLTTERGWRLDPTTDERWGIEYTHFLLVGSGRALHLTFDFDD